MANLAITIVNTIPVMGISRSEQWGVLVWGTDNWGSTEEVETNTNKQIANPLSFATSNTFQVEHLLNFGTMVLSSAISRNFVRSPITNAISFTDDITEITRGDGTWNDIFVRPTTEGTEKIFDEFDRVTDGSDGFTKVPDGTTEWS
jgi:hypothetical protein